MAGETVATRGEDEVLQRGPDGKLTVKVLQKKHTSGDGRRGKPLLIWLRDESVRLLMPTAYPPTFVTYCKWQFLQTITGQVAGILAMQAVLSTVGLGAAPPSSNIAAPDAAGGVPHANATVSSSESTSSLLAFIASFFTFSLAASARLVVKDLLGQLGGVVYGAVLSARFDTDAKRQRFLATIVEMVSNLLEILTPFSPALFLILAGIANMGKNISMMATGATRAQMHLSFVVDNNLGDITAKITSQTMGACFFGMGLGVVITQYTSNSIASQILAFIVLALVCIWACVKSSLSVEFKSLNFERAELLTFDVLRRVAGTRTLASAVLSDAAHVAVLTPSEIPKREHVVFPFSSEFSVPLEWDTPFAKIKGEEVDILKGYLLSAKNDVVRIWVSKTASDEEAFFGYVHACAIRFELSSSSSNKDIQAIISETKRFADWFVGVYSASLRAAGWELEGFAADKARSLSL